MQLNCVINSCHFVKPSHKERILGNHTITSLDSSTLCSVICSQLPWIQVVSRKCPKWQSHVAVEHCETAGKLICVSVLLDVWHWCNRKPLTTWRFGELWGPSAYQGSTTLTSEGAFQPFPKDKSLSGTVRPTLASGPSQNTGCLCLTITPLWF